MDEMQLSWYQALQLMALGPCLFVPFFLAVTARHLSQIAVPVLYFLSLACSFLLPLSNPLAISDRLQTLLLIGASAAPAASFLLIVQCMMNRVPQALYWLILAVPLIGGGQLVYATSLTEKELCIYDHLCTTPRTFMNLYDIFSISLVCLLTVLIYRRLESKEHLPDAHWRAQRKYALVLALVALNLALLGLDWMEISGYTDADRVRLSRVVVHIGFIYLALTLLFRLFDRPVELAYERIPTLKPAGPSVKDAALAAEIRKLFAEEKPYRDMGLNRAKLARRLAVTEAVLSSAVNKCFEESVSMLINRYRVEETKERLVHEKSPITAIAFEVGFSSIPSFNRVFKQFCAMSPSEYRQSHARHPS